MKLLLYKSTLLGVALLASVHPASAADEVTYHDRAAHNPRAKITGVIQEESLRGIAIKVGKDLVRIPASDIVEVDYQPPGEVTRIEFHRPFNRDDEAMKAGPADERRKLMMQAAQLYRGLVPRLAEKPYAQRYVQFRLAQLLARQAELDHALEDEAVETLASFKRTHADSWEFVACARLLAHFQERRKDWAGARKTYEDLAALPGLAPETKRECDLAVVRYLLRGKQHVEAEKKLGELRRTLPGDDPLLPLLDVNLAECRVAAGRLAEVEPQLQAVLRGGADGTIKALACNTLAEGYERANRLEDAFWQYLWVDVVYNQDADEHARALYHLSKLFRQVKKDPVRADQCREKLLRDPEFTGREYQVLAAGEK